MRRRASIVGCFLRLYQNYWGKQISIALSILSVYGDSQEFNVIAEGIFLFFKEAKRGRCAYHVVQKTWEVAFPNNSAFADEAKATPLDTAIKHWVYS
jgi:hypothetical protein